MLFDDILRTDASPRGHGESLYAFLNRVAGPDWDGVRNVLSEWHRHYPEEDQYVLQRRFQSADRRGLLGAFWELYLHELFRRLDFTVELHPQVAGVGRRPDFRLRRGSTVFLVEAVTIYEREAGSRVDGRLPEVLDDRRVITQRLGEKTRAYGRQLPHPFVIALLSYRETTGPEEVLRALFGSAAHVPEMVLEARIAGPWPNGASGFWLTRSGAQYQDVSGIITAFELLPWSIARSQPWFIANPWAHYPLNIELPLSRFDVDRTSGEIRTMNSGFPVHALFDLPSDWPPDVRFPRHSE